jgi:hypothetical protein
MKVTQHEKLAWYTTGQSTISCRARKATSLMLSEAIVQLGLLVVSSDVYGLDHRYYSGHLVEQLDVF